MQLNKIITSKAKLFCKLSILMLALSFVLPLGQCFASKSGGGFVDNSAKTGGGFTEPCPELFTVQQVEKMRDDSQVTLKGNIIKRLGKEKYLFQDATGSIEVEIDDKIWRGQTISPKDTVTIYGEVDKDWNHTSIDVDSINKQ